MLHINLSENPWKENCLMYKSAWSQISCTSCARPLAFYYCTFLSAKSLYVYKEYWCKWSFRTIRHRCPVVLQFSAACNRFNQFILNNTIKTITVKLAYIIARAQHQVHKPPSSGSVTIVSDGGQSELLSISYMFLFDHMLIFSVLWFYSNNNGQWAMFQCWHCKTNKQRPYSFSFVFPVVHKTNQTMTSLLRHPPNTECGVLLQPRNIITAL